MRRVFSIDGGGVAYAPAMHGMDALASNLGVAGGGRSRRWALRWAVPAALAMVGACGGPRADADPLTAARESRLSVRQRVDLVDTAWAEARAGRTNRSAVRGDLKDLAWGVNLPAEVRVAALRAVLDDDAAGADADSQTLVSQMLPRDPNEAVCDELSRISARKGWTSATASLVRSLSRPRAGTPDTAREEYLALRALHPGKRPEELVLGVFLDPPVRAGSLVSADRVRADAWDLLIRLDGDGTTRAGFLLDAQQGKGDSPALALMRRAMTELRVTPLSGDEYLWLTRLASDDKAWWAETAAVVAGLGPERGSGLQIRHLEPLRWASVARSEWLGLSRQEHLEAIGAALQSRSVHVRARADNETRRAVPERLEAWQDKLTWADLVALRCVDEALAQPEVVAALFAQRDLDQADRRAEYGGLLRVDRGSGDGPRVGAAAILYPPREGERTGDAEFVAPQDMLDQSNTALAHYHFHAQSIRNDRYAGPSPRDLVYAGRFGRTCLVFTSMEEGAINTDYFQPDGVVIDLGLVIRGQARARR